ncbi:hypothetical protein B0H11DRAFT_2236067 [Mycena galericulata]|nr:hypothetical protein B0H11DRAFT_2236067 [Mycena galericulata]
MARGLTTHSGYHIFTSKSLEPRTIIGGPCVNLVSESVSNVVPAVLPPSVLTPFAQKRDIAIKTGIMYSCRLTQAKDAGWPISIDFDDLPPNLCPIPVAFPLSSEANLGICTTRLHISPRKFSKFILVPHVAACLIDEDLKIALNDAVEVLESSSEYGRLFNGDLPEKVDIVLAVNPESSQHPRHRKSAVNLKSPAPEAITLEKFPLSRLTRVLPPVSRRASLLGRRNLGLSPTSTPGGLYTAARVSVINFIAHRPELHTGALVHFHASSTADVLITAALVLTPSNGKTGFTTTDGVIDRISQDAFRVSCFLLPAPPPLLVFIFVFLLLPCPSVPVFFRLRLLPSLLLLSLFPISDLPSIHPYVSIIPVPSSAALLPPLSSSHSFLDTMTRWRGAASVGRRSRIAELGLESE